MFARRSSSHDTQPLELMHSAASRGVYGPGAPMPDNSVMQDRLRASMQAPEVPQNTQAPPNGNRGAATLDVIKDAVGLGTSLAKNSPGGVLAASAWGAGKAIGNIWDMFNAPTIEEKEKHGGEAAYNALKAVPVLGSALALGEAMHGDSDEFKGAVKEIVGVGPSKTADPYAGIPMPPPTVEPNMSPVPKPEPNASPASSPEPNMSCQTPYRCD